MSEVALVGMGRAGSALGGYRSAFVMQLITKFSEQARWSILVMDAKLHSGNLHGFLVGRRGTLRQGYTGSLGLGGCGT